MKVKEVIEKLCNHEISKQDAIEHLLSIIDGLRKQNALEFVVEGVGFTVGQNHGHLTLLLPYGYPKMEGKLKRGDKVDVVVLP